VELPAPMVVAERWCGDSKRMHHVHDAHQGIVLVEGTQSSVFPWADGQTVKGHDLIHGEGWRGRQHPWEAGVRSVRLQAIRPPYGQVPVVIGDEPGQDRCSLRWLETERSAPQCIRRGRRRSGMACVLRTLTPLLAPEACQVRSDDASYGPLGLRLIGSVIVFSTARVICKGQLTMEEIIFRLQHDWRCVDAEALALPSLS
jgi:hypothetical protein